MHKIPAAFNLSKIKKNLKKYNFIVDKTAFYRYSLQTESAYKH